MGTRKRIEKHLQAALESRVADLLPEHVLVSRRPRVSIESWLGSEVSDVEWDPYSHAPKEIYLLLFNVSASRLVLCELKTRGGEGDGALMQVIDYFHILKHDADAKARLARDISSAVSGAAPVADLVSNAALYIIVAGHVSETLKHRVRYLPLTCKTVLRSSRRSVKDVVGLRHGTRLILTVGRLTAYFRDAACLIVAEGARLSFPR